MCGTGYTDQSTARLAARHRLSITAFVGQIMAVLDYMKDESRLRKNYWWNRMDTTFELSLHD